MSERARTGHEAVPGNSEGHRGLASGAAVIQSYLQTLPTTPGVYRMLNQRGDALYVGKAHQLRKRVATYASPSKLPIRLQRMIAETRSMEFVTTHTEVEALLLESNLIKKLRPRYNVLLRDDKTFPHILITGDHDFAQLMKHRGARKREGRYFGPFASAGAVNRTIAALQRAFLLRNCSDSIFRSRTRPCLQFHIKRCSAPCVGRISQEDYAALVGEAHEFLTGHSGKVQARLAQRMEEASDALEFEVAGRIRDRIRALTQVQAHQDINLSGLDDADVIALHQEGGQSCVQVFFFRGGRNYGNRAYFPSHDRHLEPEAVLSAFVGQFYDNKPPPRIVLLSHALAEHELIAEALSTRAERKVQLLTPRRGDKRKPVEHATANAREALGRRLAESTTHRRALDALAKRLDLDNAPARIEVYDNSHIQGSNAIGAMIVSGPDGLMKNAYRKFNIKTVGAGGDAEAGDDYAMMREVLTRRQAFLPWISRRAVDIIQPDTTKNGGLTESRRIAGWAYDHNVQMVSHGWNTAVGLAADLQLAAAIPVALFVEYLTPCAYIEDLLDRPFELDEEGFLEIPSEPGLGRCLDPERVARYTASERVFR